MSSTDDLRAMREAKYARARAARGGAAPSARPTPEAKPTKAAKAKPAPVAPEVTPETTALCGHRNISGRTCTREQGHAAKSHRYG